MKRLHDQTILSRIDALASLFESEHRNPVNRAIHVWIGMPLAGVGILLMCLLKWQGLVLLLLGYAAMFAGHYIFEKSPPTVVNSPLGPAAGAAFVIQQVFVRPVRRWRGTLRSDSQP